MKNFILFLVLGLTFLNVSARKFEVKFENKSNQPIQLFYQIIEDYQKEEPKFIFNLEVSSTDIFTIKLKRDEKIKFIGYGSGVETLPIIRDFYDFNKKEINHIQLVLPKLEKLNVVELNEVISKVSNDNVLNIILDTTQYSIDKMPPLGTFIFFNAKRNSSLPLKPTFWKNEEEIRVFNKKYYNIIDHVNTGNAAGLSLSGIPFLQRLGSSFTNSNLLELKWDINNAHFKQWQPTDKNVYDIISDPRNKNFISACMTEMNSENLAGGDYKLYFISSSYEVDLIKISAKKYNKVAINADMDFNVPIGQNIEIVKPVEASGSYGYLKEKLYHNVDSTTNASLKILALDYTSALNSHISSIQRRNQIERAQDDAEKLRSQILNQYSVLANMDPTLQNSEAIEVIIPIIDIINKKELEPVKIENEKELEVEVDEDTIENMSDSQIAQFNSILNQLKTQIVNYKEKIKSIDNLNQPTDYNNIIQATTSEPLDKKVIESYLDTI